MLDNESKYWWRQGGSTNYTERGGQCLKHVPEVEVTEVAPGMSVAVITPQLAYKIKGGGTQDVYDVPSETTTFVDNFVIPRGYRRKGIREASVMRSLGNYCVPGDRSGFNAVYYCQLKRRVLLPI